jgi:hypothetical protein
MAEYRVNGEKKYNHREVVLFYRLEYQKPIFNIGLSIYTIIQLLIELYSASCSILGADVHTR